MPGDEKKILSRQEVQAKHRMSVASLGSREEKCLVGGKDADTTDEKSRLKPQSGVKGVCIDVRSTVTEVAARGADTGDMTQIRPLWLIKVK